jgi:NitT/TauT family transport system substrate-binding protein
MMARLVGLLAALIIAVSPARGEPPGIRVAVLDYGTVTWELDTVRRLGLDEANGFRLEVRGMGGTSAARIAFQGGEADAMVADWLWVARQRAAGRDYVFLPYSRAVGGLMVPGDSGARALPDLAGGRIGIAGGPLDKSWLILRAHALETHGLDLEAETDQVFAAPPLVMQKAVSGAFDGAINYWHYQAKMRARGMRELVGVRAAAEALGLDPDTPLLGYVFRGGFVEERPELVAGFARASRAAKARLAEDDAAWEPLRGRMGAASEAEFEALRAGFRAGIPEAGPVDRAAAERMFALMRRLGGRALTGDAETLPDGIFLAPPR